MSKLICDLVINNHIYKPVICQVLTSTSDNVVLIPLFSYFMSAVNICYDFGMRITFLILKLLY